MYLCADKGVRILRENIPKKVAELAVSGFASPGSRIQGPGSRIQGPGVGSSVQGPGSRIQGPGVGGSSEVGGFSPPLRVSRGPEVPGSRANNKKQITKNKEQITKNKEQRTNNKEQRTKK